MSSPSGRKKSPKVVNAFYIPSGCKQIRLGLKRPKDDNRIKLRWNDEMGKFEKVIEFK